MNKINRNRDDRKPTEQTFADMSFEISLNLKDNKLISLKLPEAGRHALLRLRSTRITNNPRKDDGYPSLCKLFGPFKNGSRLVRLV